MSTAPRHRAEWERIGALPERQGFAQELWRCAHCGEERVLFTGIDSEPRPYWHGIKGTS